MKINSTDVVTLWMALFETQQLKTNVVDCVWPLTWRSTEERRPYSKAFWWWRCRKRTRERERALLSWKKPHSRYTHTHTHTTAAMYYGAATSQLLLLHTCTRVVEENIRVVCVCVCVRNFFNVFFLFLFSFRKTKRKKNIEWKEKERFKKKKECVFPARFKKKKENVFLFHPEGAVPRWTLQVYSHRSPVELRRLAFAKEKQNLRLRRCVHR